MILQTLYIAAVTVIICMYRLHFIKVIHSHEQIFVYVEPQKQPLYADVDYGTGRLKITVKGRGFLAAFPRKVLSWVLQRVQLGRPAPVLQSPRVSAVLPNRQQLQRRSVREPCRQVPK